MFRTRRVSAVRGSLDAGLRVTVPQPSTYQAKRDNSLYGGIDRRFAPLEPAVLRTPAMKAILRAYADALAPGGFSTETCEVMVHLIRIAARPGVY